MIATDPLPASFWDAVGLRARETFGDFRNLIIYGQRTDDDRLAFGGRGAPYHFGSKVKPDFDRDARVFAELRRVLADLFPELVAIGGGDVSSPRDFDLLREVVRRLRELVYLANFRQNEVVQPVHRITAAVGQP